MNSGLVEDDIAVSVIDALTSQICVVDPEGTIFAVNRAWKQFTADNSSGQVRDHVGVNYLNVCRHAVGPGSEEAPDFANGLLAVLRREQEFFQIEYSCHSPNEMRWFVARVSPLRRRSSSTEQPNIGAVVSHMNITDRKFIEMDYARLAATDPLTGLPNRRFFDEFAKLDMDRFLRFGKPSSLLMVDLDHFKNINDTYGHAAGDEILCRVASLGKLVFRSGDLFARWGGEEFVCLLPGTDEWGAILAAEKLRSAIEQLSIISGGHAIPVTASVGVSSVDSADRVMDDALLRADRALYRAKNDGRNCVRNYEFRAGLIAGGRKTIGCLR